MNFNTTRFITLYALATVALGTAAPFRTKPVDIEGKISSWVWIDRTKFEYEGDDFGLKRSNKSPRYLVVVDTKSLNDDKRLRLQMLTMANGYQGVTHALAHASLKENQAIIMISGSRKIKGLKKGAIIKIQSYALSGDEFGVSSSFAKMTLDGKAIKKKATQEDDSSSKDASPTASPPDGTKTK